MDKLMMPKQRIRGVAQCGLSLVEAVVIIVILATLMVLILPALGQYRQRARTAKGLSNLGQIVKAISGFAVENANTLPVGYVPPATVNGEEVETDWVFIVNDFLTGMGDTYAKVNPDRDNIRFFPLEIFRDPNAGHEGGNYHYSAHPVLMPDNDTVNDWPNWRTYRWSRFKRPSEVILIMDGTLRPPDPDKLHIVPWTSFATAVNLDDGAMKPWITSEDVVDPTNPLLDDNVFYNASNPAGDNGTAIDPGKNLDTDDITGTDHANIRWRQGADGPDTSRWAANFAFPDGHAKTIKAPDVHNANVRIDR